MATVGTQLYQSVFNFAPNQTHFWVFNLTSTTRIRTFYVKPLLISPQGAGNAIGMTEITRIRYSVKASEPFFQVFIDIFNPGALTINYEIWMGYIQP